MLSHTFRTFSAVVILGIASSVHAQTVCKVYSLAEFGDDGGMIEWIGEMIPEVIEPQSWKETSSGVKPVLTYNKRAKLLVVYQTPEVHEAIDAFVAEVKKSLPAPESKTALIRHETAVPVVTELPYVGRLFTTIGYSEESAPAELAEAAEGIVVEAIESRPPHQVNIELDGVDLEGFKIKNFKFTYVGNGIVDSNIIELYRTQLQLAIHAEQLKEKSADLKDALSDDPLVTLHNFLGDVTYAAAITSTGAVDGPAAKEPSDETSNAAPKAIEVAPSPELKAALEKYEATRTKTAADQSAKPTKKRKKK